jgi:hypothetical protein
MHKIFRACIQVNVLPLSLLSSPHLAVICPEEIAAAVKHPEQHFDTTKHHKFYVWEHSHDYHCFNKGGSYVKIPIGIKI